MQKKGTIKFYNNEKGFGFIFDEETKSDIYFHINDWKNGSVPNGNDDVKFDLSKSKNNKPKAININLLKSANDKKQENFSKNDDRVICHGCNKKIVPRVITDHGTPMKSICPYCATEIAKFYKGCFIATAVYGDYNHVQVVKLRQFRDNCLLTNELGIKFVYMYYKHSPKFADYLKDKKIFTYPIRKLLDGFVYLFEISNKK